MMIFNGIEKDYLNVSVNFTLPTITEIEHEIHQNNRFGGRVKKSMLKELYIDVPVIIKDDGTGIDNLKVDLIGWLKKSESKRLEFNHFPDIYYMARLARIDLQDEFNIMRGTLTFLCEVPFKLGKSKDIEVSSTYSNYIVIGQVETPWKSRTVFSSAAISFTLENDKGGLILLNYNFIQGDILEIDYLKRKIIVSGTVRPEILSMQSYWFDLKPGVNRLRASRATTITYDERFY
ncbi:distal tail protein Dit [Alkalihalobacillus trypoxylicola]|uniref:Phage tail protein n=1 Tax=Alkalihalobacillus trypoxylicola TaxID=519424 RepID=A0A161PKU0_9BACI|nr:distal tail protein Dit [Alkalihalobacillus trypoxylicola]KYG34906.1 hypothetical protein AZF04_00815 [Alkalihalobacillus trypoxylicola]